MVVGAVVTVVTATIKSKARCALFTGAGDLAFAESTKIVYVDRRLAF